MYRNIAMTQMHIQGDKIAPFQAQVQFDKSLVQNYLSSISININIPSILNMFICLYAYL